MENVGVQVRFEELKLATGPTLRCAVAGRPDGEPILFLHGYTDCWLSAAPLLARLPETWRVLAPDQRGHGGSERPAGGYHMASLAADAAALLESAGAARATVVGHSMGSFVAQRLAIDNPERVSRLLLVGAAPCGGIPAVGELAAALEGFGEEVPRAFVEEFQRSCAQRPLPEAFLDAVVSESCRIPARVWRTVMAAISSFDTRAELGRIAAPTRIVWGDRDAIFGRGEQETLRAGIPGAELAVYEETGHTPHWEEPERFARELEAFVVGTSPSREAAISC